MELFNKITFDDYRELLLHLIKLDHLQLTSENTLILGLKGEKIVNNFKFYAVFPEEDDFTVMAESSAIGKIEVPPPPGERLTLAGRSWEVMEVDMKSKVVHVKRIKGKIKTYWGGGNIKTDNRVLWRMKEVLASPKDYPYLQKGAKFRMDEAYFLARKSGLDTYNVFSLGGKKLRRSAALLYNPENRRISNPRRLFKGIHRSTEHPDKHRRNAYRRRYNGT